MKASNYRAKNGEANFGKPITTQVVGGTHITLELVTKKGNDFIMTRWPKGLPGHDDPPDVLRFPHGLILFGETLEQCASRLVHQQLGMAVEHVDIAYLDSYVDNFDHWHIEPGCIVEVSGQPKIPDQASEIITFSVDEIPEMTFWPRDEFLELVTAKLPSVLEKQD